MKHKTSAIIFAILTLIQIILGYFDRDAFNIMILTFMAFFTGFYFACSGFEEKSQ